ncbi:MAG: hypothetical protein OXU77_18375 [Gammaproteobacteria bacterium]|nr:hypothetical protein [Gammaproteobacteria bacterium]MDE0443815.1 hypothetical protein [Gammaproteobacteria bacterium]
MFAFPALAVCFAEFRSSARRVRTFLCIAVATAGILGTLVLTTEATSQMAPLAGAYAPRFVLSAMGNYWLWLFLLAVVFLAFDARQQDERARIAEALDVRPISNLALLGGRLAGTVLVAWLAFVGIAVLIQAGGNISGMVFEASGSETASVWSSLAVAVEPVSLVTLLTIDALPALTFTAALVMFLTSVLRVRVPTILIALMLIGVHVYAVASVPMFLLPTVSVVTSYADFASDIVPSVPDTSVVLQRVALLLFGAAFLIGAAAFYPRDDGRSRLRQGMAAAVLGALGAAAVAGAAAHAANDLAVREQWLAAQEAAEDLQYPDLRQVRGEVRIEPGSELTLDLEMQVAAPTGETLGRLHFTLNPALDVSAVQVAGTSVDATNANGILGIDLPAALEPDTELTVSLQARGVPDGRFSYLDSAVDWRLLRASNRLLLLGTDALLFDRHYVALPPGAMWLPTTGPNLADRPPDEFTVDLSIHVPEAWVVAGPGRRERVAAGHFRFSPNAPVPEVGIFASRFERRTVETEHVTLEMLAVPQHAGQLDGFAEVMAGDYGLVAQIGGMLRSASERGLPYPYEVFTMVEVPSRLRGYGGGRQMDTAMFPPGLALLPEYGFPTRFERVYRDRRYSFGGGPALPTEAADRKRGMLRRLFALEGAAEAPHHAVRNVFPAEARGPGALAVDALCLILAVRTIWRLYGAESRTLFAAHRFARPATDDNPLRQFVWGGGPERMPVVSNEPHVWETAERVALTGIADLEDGGLAMDVLALRVGQTAKIIVDRYGSERVADLLVALRRQNAGAGIVAQDLSRAGAEAGMDLDGLLGDWLNATDMPAFSTSPVEVFRIGDDDDGTPRYQVLVKVRNDRPVPGLVRFTAASRIAATGDEFWSTSDSFPVPGESAIEVGLTTPGPLEVLWLRPYLSLNRGDQRLPVPQVDETVLIDRQPLDGARSSVWHTTSPGIVVDDLDHGFSAGSRTEVMRFGQTREQEFAQTDAGLPVYRRVLRPWWMRQALPTAWGRYRRTVARIASGRGDNRAVFEAELPEGGRWLLQYHVPSLRVTGLFSQAWGPQDELGTYQLEVVAGQTKEMVDFDAAAAETGWNEVDVFDLPAGTVTVWVSNSTTGATVIADAIRWDRRP